MNRLNRWLAVKITQGVGTMWCAYAFAVLALVGLPAALHPGGVGLIQWFAQTFLQLVLLSVLAVGQQVANDKADEHRAAIRGVHTRLDQHAEHLAQTSRRLGEIQHHLTTSAPHGATPKGAPRA